MLLTAFAFSYNLYHYTGFRNDALFTCSFTALAKRRERSKNKSTLFIGTRRRGREKVRDKKDVSVERGNVSVKVAKDVRFGKKERDENVECECDACLLFVILFVSVCVRERR